MLPCIMKILGTCLLAIITHVYCEPSPAHEVHLLKTAINTYDEYFYSRYLETERQTCNLSGTVVNKLQNSFSKELLSTLTETVKQLDLIKGMVRGTIAEDCVFSISKLLTKAVKHETKDFKSCSTTSLAKQKQLSAILDDEIIAYNKHKTNALSSLDKCLASLPNKNLKKQRDMCTIYQYGHFINKYKNETAAFFKSPCMHHFENSVLTCITESATSIAAKTKRILQQLHTCSALDYDPELSKNIALFKSSKQFKSTISDQIKEAQAKYSALNSEIEGHLKHYYELEEQAQSTYVIDSKPLDYFTHRVRESMSPYHKSIAQAQKDNPDPKDVRCGATAKEAIDGIIAKASKEYLACDKEVVANTKLYMAEVRKKFSAVTKQLPLQGNVAILECLNEGLVFGTNDIREGYDLRLNRFKIAWHKHLVEIKATVEKLHNYKITYFEMTNSPLPCGEVKLQEVMLSGDHELYKYRRCMFQGTGTDYAVTTPAAPTYGPATPTTDDVNPFTASTSLTSRYPPITTTTFKNAIALLPKWVHKYYNGSNEYQFN